MDEYFKITLKNHKVLKKKILFLEYLPTDFYPSQDLLKEMIEYYMGQLKINKDEDSKLIVVFDLRNIEKYDKKKVWEGAKELKKHDDYFVKHIGEAFIIIENQLAIDLINIIIKVLGTNVKTTLVKNVAEALNKLV